MVLASWSPSTVFLVPLLAGFIASVAITIWIMWSTKIVHERTTFVLEKREVGSLSYAWWHQSVWTTAAWTFKDSWATNITAVGAALGVVSGSNGTLTGSLSQGSTPHEFVSLGVIFGGASVLAPLVYAALAKEPPEMAIDAKGRARARKDAKAYSEKSSIALLTESLSAESTFATSAETLTSPHSSPKVPSTSDHATNVEGTIGGLLIASAITLFATLGGLAALATWAQNSTLGGAEPWTLTVASLVAAVFVGIYAVRSFHVLATYATTDGTKQPRPSFISATGVSATL